jgi:hypothetical protein
VRQVAVRDKEARFTALLHHVDVDRLRDAYRAINPNAAPGVDTVTWAAYGQELEDNLRGLHERLHAGRYRARPTRRVYIPKTDGRLRPLGIAALEDKILQRSVVEVLNAIYEADFRGFSYGFRPGRGPHDALDALTVGLERKKVNWVLDADIRDFFGQLDRGKACEGSSSTGSRIRGSCGWSINGWPQGSSKTGSGRRPSGVQRREHRYRRCSPTCTCTTSSTCGSIGGEATRHAATSLSCASLTISPSGLEHRDDADRFLTALRDRFAKFGLELHPDKTRLIEFGRYAAERRRARGLGKPETFTFLGFTHICATGRQGRFWVRRKTESKRMRAKLQQVNDQLRRRRHSPIPDQGRWLASVLRGHFAYYAVPGNDAPTSFLYQVQRLWFRSLRRRSQRHRLTWERMDRIATRWLPLARVMHPYPEVRFAATYPR